MITRFLIIFPTFHNHYKIKVTLLSELPNKPTVFGDLQEKKIINKNNNIQYHNYNNIIQKIPTQCPQTRVEQIQANNYTQKLFLLRIIIRSFNLYYV